ncbi:uncharacterized protein DNG_03232 [Cephalotrichum gorgonifer]|uniref:Uncharacterized protein n=1 Tax=Cephalotrichum gorgonifer TaxID=2041049 RepID=A0AAE8MUH7_9PEZI|nr:uncharacterized protein DNG_03232 [Cephalotrichum gorgonifer]
MSTTTFQTVHKADGDREKWEEAAKLFSENYGVWGPGSGREGKRVKLGKQRLVEQYLPGERSTYTSVLVNGKLAGQAFASRWEYDGKTLREDEDEIFGIMSSHPAACLAAANAYSKSIEKIDLPFIKEHARAVMDASPVEYIREAAPMGTAFDEDDPSGLVSGADSEFYVDHTEPLKALEAVRQECWPLGDLPDGYEFLLLLHPRPRRSRSGPARKTPSVA